MKSWSNKVWKVTVKETDQGKELEIRKKGFKIHKETIAPGADENCPLDIPVSVMYKVLDLLEDNKF
jgi:hypothetical protein